MQSRADFASIMKRFFGNLILLSVYALSSLAELTEFQWTADEVSGIYKNEDGSLGIKFVSRRGYLEIKSLDDITLVHLSSYREVDKRMARSVHVLDGEYLQHKSRADSHLDRLIGNTTKSVEEAVNDLLDQEEMGLLEDASRAVGDQGVTGRNTPAVLPFYMFALEMTKLLDRSLQNFNTSVNELDEQMSPPAYAPPRQKRIFGWIRIRFRGNSCDKYKRYKDCKGLCGRGCTCWRWVCGDCCFHKACFDHDDCCERHGYWHWRCIFAIDVIFFCDLGFVC